MTTDTKLDHPGPHKVHGELIDDLKFLVSYLVIDNKSPPMLDQKILTRAFEAAKNFPDNDPNEATDQEHFEMREAAWLLVQQLETHKEMMHGLDWTLVTNVSRWFEPAPTRKEVKNCPGSRDHVFANTAARGRACIYCGVPDPSVKGIAMPYTGPHSTTDCGDKQCPMHNVAHVHVRDKVPAAGVVQMVADAALARGESFTIIGEATEYKRITLSASAVEWLKAKLCVIKVGLLVERKQLLRERGPDTTRHVAQLSSIETDLAELNRVIDALK